MPTLDDMRQGTTPFDPFLHATVGEDRNGNTVTVLSTLARLGLEPRQAASDLAGMTRDDARSRLGVLLARFRDVPALVQDHGAITQRLIDLLPATSGLRTGQGTKRTPGAGVMGIAPLFLLVLLALHLVLSLWLGSDSAGR